VTLARQKLTLGNEVYSYYGKEKLSSP
jgi:hypothetical protein